MGRMVLTLGNYFVLQSSSQKSTQYLLEIESIFSIRWSMKLYAEEEYRAEEDVMRTRISIFFGVIITCTIFNVFLFAAIRKIYVLHLILVNVTMYLMIIGGISGVGRVFLFPEWIFFQSYHLIVGKFLERLRSLYSP